MMGIAHHVRILIASKKAEEDEGGMKLIYIILGSLIFFAIIAYIIIQKMRGMQ